MGRGALETARAIGDRALIAAAASALCLGEAAAGEIAAARGHRDEARRASSSGCPTPSWRPALEALYYLGWAENYLEHYDEAIAHVGPRHRDRPRDRRGPAARPDDARQGLPVRDAGPHGRGDRAVRDGRRGDAAVGQPARPVLGAVRARLRALPRGRPRGARSRPARRARASAAGWPAARCPPAGGGPGWVLAHARSSRRGDVEPRAARSCTRSAATTWRTRSRSSAASTGRSSRSSSSRAGDATAADGYARRAEEHAASLGLRAADGRRRCARGRPSCSPAASRRGGRAPATSRPSSPPAIGARLQAAFSLAAAGRALAAAGDRARRDRRRCARPRASSTRAARCACATRCAASCASSARAPSRAGRRPPATPASAALTQARARDRRPRHRPQDQPRDRRRAVPEREDDRVAPAQHLRQARRLLAGRGRAHDRARPGGRRRSYGASPSARSRKAVVRRSYSAGWVRRPAVWPVSASSQSSRSSRPHPHSGGSSGPRPARGHRRSGAPAARCGA